METRVALAASFEPSVASRTRMSSALPRVANRVSAPLQIGDGQPRIDRPHADHDVLAAGPIAQRHNAENLDRRVLDGVDQLGQRSAVAVEPDIDPARRLSRPHALDEELE